MAESVASSQEDVPELRVIVVGETGSGKSTLCNKLLDLTDGDSPAGPDQRDRSQQHSGEDDRAEGSFAVDGGFDSCSQQCQFLTGPVRLNGRIHSLKVVDTRGLFDTLESDENTAIEITRSFALCCPGGPHAILHVVPYGRFTTQSKIAFDKVCKLFGKAVKDHLIIVFSHGEKLGEMPIEDALAQAKSKNIVEVRDFIQTNYTVSSNIPERRDTERAKLLEKISEVSDNGVKVYTSKILEKLTQMIEERVRKLMVKKGLSRSEAISAARQSIVRSNARKKFFKSLLKEVFIIVLVSGGTGLVWGVGYGVVRGGVSLAVRYGLRRAAISLLTNAGSKLASRFTK